MQIWGGSLWCRENKITTLGWKKDGGRGVGVEGGEMLEIGKGVIN